ncbi:hypothetical protein Tco_0904465 [Tanacetum coccineum]
MSSSNHPIIVPSDSDIEDAFSSINVPDYFPATPGNTSPDSSNDLTKYLLATLVFSPLHDDPYMEIMQAYDATDNELPIPLLPAPIAPPTIVSPSPVLSLSPMFDSRDLFPLEEISPPKDIENPVESPIPISPSSSVGSSSPVKSTTPPPIPIPMDKSILRRNRIAIDRLPEPVNFSYASYIAYRDIGKITMILLPSDFLKPLNTKPPIGSLTSLSPYLSLEVLNSKISVMPPKRTSTSAAPAMTQAAIRQLVVDSVAAALETTYNQYSGAYLLRDKIAFVHFMISTLETTLEDIQVRHQLYMKDLQKPTS